jgi:hypothetical protein
MMRVAFKILVLLLLVTGCSEQKAQPERAQNAATSEPAKLTWAAAEGWIEEDPQSRMRTAQYRLPKVDGDTEDALVAVFYFGGGGGSVQANLDRWIGQFMQADGSPSKDAAKISKSKVNNLSQTIVDLTGNYQFKTTPMGPVSELKMNFRMLAAVVESSSGPWFVKLTGPEKTVAHWEASFHQFMKSFQES